MIEVTPLTLQGPHAWLAPLSVQHHDDLVEAVLTALAQTARTGKIGDGKIFVTSVERVVRIRTGEQDDTAI